MIPLANLKTAEEVREHARRIQARQRAEFLRAAALERAKFPPPPPPPPLKRPRPARAWATPTLIPWVRSAPHVVLRCVSHHFGVGVQELRAPRGRGHALSSARFAAVYILKQLNPMRSLLNMERFFQRDHTSILYALRQTVVRAKRDPEYAKLVDLAGKAAATALGLEWSNIGQPTTGEPECPTQRSSSSLYSE